MASINDRLSEDCIRLILVKFNLRDLISLRRVCPYWSRVISAICLTKNSLKLFILANSRYSITLQGLSKDDVEIMHPNRLQPKQEALFLQRKFVKQHLCDFLGSLLPNLDSLMIFAQFKEGKQNFFQLRNILSKWPNLINLSLFRDAMSAAPGPNENSNRMYRRIGAMQALTCLNLKLGHPLSVPCLNSLGARVLGQLEHFALDQYSAPVENILARLGPNCSNLRLEPGNVLLPWLTEPHFESLRFPQALTSLTAAISAETVVAYVCTRFPNLISLDLTFPIIQLDPPVLRQLRSLRQLISLSLNNFNLQVDIENAPSQSIPVLLQVQSLHLANFGSAYGFDSGDALCRTLATVFPNLQTLTLRSPMNYFSGSIEVQDLDYFAHLRKYQIFTNNSYAENIL